MARKITRREVVLGGLAATARPPAAVVDIHQHTHYAGRSDDHLIRHQHALGIGRTVLLPAGSRLGLDAQCHGNDSVLRLATLHPTAFACFANEDPRLPEARLVLERFLRFGALGIGEQKFPVDCDSPEIHLVAQIADHFQVPVLLHFQHGAYNTGFLRFHRMLERYPRVAFIGHAQTWWGNIDRAHRQEVLYPRGPVTPGGYTDRLLSGYPNMYGDLSAGSGLNALTRDEEHARAFLLRHRKKLLYGSDCDDSVGAGPGCSGAQCLALLRRLVPDEGVLADILGGNARRVILERQR